MLSLHMILSKVLLLQVLKDVAVLDTINPGGFYTAKIRLFGPFAAASASFKPDRMPWVFAEGIEDPLYGNVGGDAEQAALWGTLRKLRLACAGLAQFLHQLQKRYHLTSHQDMHAMGASDLFCIP